MPTQRNRGAGPPDRSRDRRQEPKGRTAQIGNLTNDPELCYPQEGPCFARCGLAVEKPVKEGDWAGERTTTFYELKVFAGMAEHFAETCTKGMRVLVIGRAELEVWYGDDGKEKRSKNILCDAIGPDLRWAVATVEKVPTAAGRSRNRDDGYFDEEPF